MRRLPHRIVTSGHLNDLQSCADRLPTQDCNRCYRQDNPRCGSSGTQRRDSQAGAQHIVVVHSCTIARLVASAAVDPTYRICRQPAPAAQGEQDALFHNAFRLVECPSEDGPRGYGT